MEERWFKIKRIMLGIKGLDELFKGIYKGSIILLAGNPGTGKTTMAAKFIYEGAKMGEKGIYVSFVETKEDFYRNMKDLGMDFSSLEEEGSFAFMEGITVSSVEALSEFLEEVIREMGEFGADRIAIDSISAVLQMGSQEISKVREMMHNFFYRGAKVRGVTTILIEELPYGEVSVGYGIEEFIVDGVIILKARIIKGKIYRYMEIRKMRGNEVKYGEIPFIIGVPEVINIRVPQDVKGLPSGINPSKGFIKVAMGDREVSFARGTQNLFAVDPRIDSLPIISSLILPTILKERLTIHYRSYLHGEKTIRDYLSKCFNDKEEYAEGLKNFFIRNVNPTSQTIISLELLIGSWEELEKPDVIIVEGSGNYIELVSDIESYRQEQYNDLIRRALHNITGFYFIHTKMKKLTSIPLINHYDNVFYITLNKRGDIIIKPFKIHLKPVPIDPIVVEREKIESCFME